jgi:hypothetical protein
MALALAPSVASGVGTLANHFYGRKNRTPRFGNTEYGRLLNTRRTEGELNPSSRALIVGESGRQAGNIAHERKADLMGRFSAQGFGNSIAGNAALGEPDAMTQRIMGETGGRVSLLNERSKADAAEEYARLDSATEEQRRGERKGRFSDLLGGLVNSVAGGISAYQGAKDYNRNEAVNALKSRWMIEDRDYETDMREIDLQQRYDDQEFMDITGRIQLLLDMGEMDKASALYMKYFESDGAGDEVGGNNPFSSGGYAERQSFEDEYGPRPKNAPGGY